MADERDRSLRAYAPLALRLLLGALFIAHLYWKLAVLPGGLSAWWRGLEASGYPAFVPAYVLSAELVGAALLIPGVLTRYAALYAMPMMAGRRSSGWSGKASTSPTRARRRR